MEIRMKNMIKTMLACAFVMIPFTAVAAEKNIVETAVGAGQFTTLVELLKEAKLVGALEGEGPFTVFAPTDEAFKKVPSKTLASLKGDKEKLKKVLTYHVVQGKVPAAKVVNLREAKTLAGENIKIKTKDGAVQVNTANVVKADIMASNGVIHVVDEVLIP